MTSVHGTWRLVRAVARNADGKELPTPYGGQGMGRVSLDIVFFGGIAN